MLVFPAAAIITISMQKNPPSILGDNAAILCRLLGIDSAILSVGSEWSASRDGHRHEVRAAIAAALADRQKFSHLNLNPSVREALFDLSKPPRISGVSISISHCPSAGGFVINPGSVQVGLDLEEVDRVQEPAVARISRTDEYAAAPSAALLWAAKEATFKSLLGASQPSVLGQITINSWTQPESGIWRFAAGIQGLTHVQPQGLVVALKHLVLGLAKF
jgi:hypothetical protein